MKHKSVKEALEYVARNQTTDLDPIETPVWQLVAQSLFDIANRPDTRVKGSVARANKARKMLFDRLVGIRKPGSHPAMVKGDEVEFLDLTELPEVER